MKKLFSLLMVCLLVVSVMPMVFAEEAEIGGDVDVDITTTCTAPEIFLDPTARVWNPNDQTIYTAGEYGLEVTNAYGEIGYEVSERGNYIFTGETITYYVAVYDEDGEDDIDPTNVQLLVGGIPVGSCAEVDMAALGITDTYLTDHFSLNEAYVTGTNDGDYEFYACTLIVQGAWSGEVPVSVEVTDTCGSTTVPSLWTDLLNFNPTLSLTLTGGPISFGSVEEGTTALSNTIYIANNATVGSGVIMDMYIASDDYFTDPINPGAICPTGNGIRYDQFSYYATKGSLDSGENNGITNVGLGEDTGICEAGADEFVTLPSHSGNIDDMCRVLDVDEDASFLTQGADMSFTFKLDVPTTCQGSFTGGSFHFVGRVV